MECLSQALCFEELVDRYGKRTSLGSSSELEKLELMLTIGGVAKVGDGDPNPAKTLCWFHDVSLGDRVSRIRLDAGLDEDGDIVFAVSDLAMILDGYRVVSGDELEWCGRDETSGRLL